MSSISVEDLRKQLRNNEISGLYLLYGAETYLRDAAIKTITEKTLKDAPLREFNETTESLASVDIQQAIAAAEQLPMIAARRVVKITDLNKIKEADEEVLMRYAARPAETSVVLLVADELDKRRKLVKNLFETAVSVEFLPLNEGDLANWARKHLKEKAATIDDRALGHIIGLIGSNLRTLASELDKLAVAALPDANITIELVDELVAYSRELSNFDLTDHLLAKNRRRALETLRKLLDDRAEPLMLLGLIASNYRRLLLAKEIIARGASTDEVFRAISLPPFKREGFLATARRTDARALAKSLERIAGTDLAIKTSLGGGGAEGARLQIEMLVCELALI